MGNNKGAGWRREEEKVETIQSQVRGRGLLLVAINTEHLLNYARVKIYGKLRVGVANGSVLRAYQFLVHFCHCARQIKIVIISKGVR